MTKPQKEQSPAVKAVLCFQATAIRLAKPSKSQAMRLQSAGLLSDRALTQLFATRPHWGRE